MVSEMPTIRHTWTGGAPASACLSANAIWNAVWRDRFTIADLRNPTGIRAKLQIIRSPQGAAGPRLIDPQFVRAADRAHADARVPNESLRGGSEISTEK
jgi:hypothetical protein